jgi:hypothetical protein
MNVVVCLLWSLAAAAPSVEDGVVLTGLVATAAAEVEGVDVLTRADLRAALAVESDKQALGCADESCLAEIAAALDARAVLFGTLGALDDEFVLQLNLFDSQQASSAGRSVARAPSTRELAAAAEEKTRTLVRAFAQDRRGSGRIRVLVLDLEVTGATLPAAGASSSSSSSPSSLSSSGWLVPVGAGAATLGVVGLGVGIVADVLAVQAFEAADSDRGLDVKSAREKYAESDAFVPWAIGGYVVGGVVTVVGAALLTVGLIGGDDEPAPSSTPAPAGPRP